jgi:hypothetical protein
MGRKVEILYDPSWENEVEVRHKDFKPFMAKELTIGEFCGTRREIPEEKKPVLAEGSRLLDGLKKNLDHSQKESHVATTFKQIWEESSHV